MTFKPIYKLLDWIALKVSINESNFIFMSNNERAMDIMANNLDLLDDIWSDLCANPSAIPLIEQNIENLGLYCWRNLCENQNAICILEKNPYKINWFCLCANPSAIPLIEKNLKN